MRRSSHSREQQYKKTAGIEKQPEIGSWELPEILWTVCHTASNKAFEHGACQDRNSGNNYRIISLLGWVEPICGKAFEPALFSCRM